MQEESTEIPQIEVQQTPANCPIPPPCPVSPPKQKSGKVFLKVILLLIFGLIIAFLVLTASGLTIVKKESLLDVWFSKNTPTPVPTEFSEPTVVPLPTTVEENVTASLSTTPSLTDKNPIKIKSISLLSSTVGPLVIKGTVDSGWMFEGSFPITLLDDKRVEIASGSGKEVTPGSWQSGKPVDFSVFLTFTTKAASGFLVFKNDNPSGLPENQKVFELPIKFSQR